MTVFTRVVRPPPRPLNYVRFWNQRLTKPTGPHGGSSSSQQDFVAVLPSTVPVEESFESTDLASTFSLQGFDKMLTTLIEVRYPRRLLKPGFHTIAMMAAIVVLRSMWSLKLDGFQMIAAIARKSRVGMGPINKPSSNLAQTFERWPPQIKDVLFRRATFLFSLFWSEEGSEVGRKRENTDFGWEVSSRKERNLELFTLWHRSYGLTIENISIGEQNV